MNIKTFDKQNVPPREWAQTLRSVVGRTNEVCQGLVASTYIRKDALNHSNYLIVGYVPGREVRGKVTQLLGGFLIANETEFPGFLYIDVVCANQPGLGEAMLNAAEKRASQRGLEGLVLSSLPHVVGYYRRIGYRNRETCDEENPKLSTSFVTMAKPLIDRYKKDVAKYIYDKEGAEYRKFLNELRKSNLAKNKNCKTVTDCNKDGYIMTKCFVEKSASTPRKSPSRTAASPRAKSPSRTAASPRAKSPSRTKTAASVSPRATRTAVSPRKSPSKRKSASRAKLSPPKFVYSTKLKSAAAEPTKRATSRTRHQKGFYTKFY
jgi:ribosomal protein S18 acetylase RimI-like enzyme